jgi:hypothetical protein
MEVGDMKKFTLSEQEEKYIVVRLRDSTRRTKVQ